MHNAIRLLSPLAILAIASCGDPSEHKEVAPAIENEHTLAFLLGRAVMPRQLEIRSVRSGADVVDGFRKISEAFQDQIGENLHIEFDLPAVQRLSELRVDRSDFLGGGFANVALADQFINWCEEFGFSGEIAPSRLRVSVSPAAPSAEGNAALRAKGSE